ncbi:dihydrodipicolinate synthase family protein [Nocardia cyriacigeorgica]|uniref:dihydrodipicolinate synthase family protein n=1 Tax=Nocardia cyriacigeorgica TaxID=135487 RepID=UPI0035C66B45
MRLRWSGRPPRAPAWRSHDPAGLVVPLITPFTADGELAPEALEHHAHQVLDDGATGIVALGTTGLMSRIPSEVAVLAGDDLYAAPMLALGAREPA